MEAAGFFGASVGGDVTRGHDNQNERDGYHEEAKHDIACCFKTGLTGGEPVGVDFIDGTMGYNEKEVGERVEDRVGHGCE